MYRKQSTLIFSCAMGALLMLMGSVAMGQTYTAKDTVNVRDKHMMRQAMYEANQEAFRPPRKNNWSVGVQTGLAYISGDIRAERGQGLGINVRRALGHVISLRGALSTGYATGLNWRPNGGFFRNSALNGANDPAADYTSASYPYVFYNYKMRYWDAGLQGVVTLGNISFYNKEPKVTMYGFAGVGAMIYTTSIDALDENGAIYDYSNIDAGQDLSLRKDVLNSLHNLLDGEYETAAESHPNKPTLFDRTLLPTVQVGAAVNFKLSRRVDIALEHRVTWTTDDLLDGHRWEETLTLTSNSDYLQFTSVGINFRIGKGEESYWWQNPLAGPMTDIRDLKRFNEGGVKDSDNDGVPNTRDKENNTPEGVLVDAQGRAIDSDGDGIQDFRDKEPFSPKGAEVDASGVAKDADEDGVIDFYDQEPNTASGTQADARGVGIEVPAGSGQVEMPLPMINFDLGKSEVHQDYFPDLYRLAKRLEANPNEKLAVIGHADVRGRSKRNEELSQARAQAVVNILTKSFGVDPARVTIESKGSDDLLIQGLPGVYSSENEALHFLNRRVEFRIDQ